MVFKTPPSLAQFVRYWAVILALILTNIVVIHLLSALLPFPVIMIKPISEVLVNSWSFLLQSKLVFKTKEKSS